MPTMRADDLVVAAQGRTYPHSDRFLANVGVHHPRDIPSVKFFDRSLVEGANSRHLTIHGEQLLRREGHCRLLSLTATLARPIVLLSVQDLQHAASSTLLRTGTR